MDIKQYKNICNLIIKTRVVSIYAYVSSDYKFNVEISGQKVSYKKALEYIEKNKPTKEELIEKFAYENRHKRILDLKIKINKVKSDIDFNNILDIDTIDLQNQLEFLKQEYLKEIKNG